MSCCNTTKTHTLPDFVNMLQFVNSNVCLLQSCLTSARVTTALASSCTVDTSSSPCASRVCPKMLSKLHSSHRKTASAAASNSNRHSHSCPLYILKYAKYAAVQKQSSPVNRHHCFSSITTLDEHSCVLLDVPKQLRTLRWLSRA
jgi:hypothetical protein